MGLQKRSGIARVPRRGRLKRDLYSSCCLFDQNEQASEEAAGLPDQLRVHFVFEIKKKEKKNETKSRDLDLTIFFFYFLVAFVLFSSCNLGAVRYGLTN